MVSRIAAILLLTAMTLGAADLVKNGVPCADIVISENPEPGVLAAAQDLRKYIRQMSGAELNIVTPGKSALPGKICVGESRCSREAGYRMPEFRSSGYDIWVRGSCVVLTGPVTLHQDPEGSGKRQFSVVTSLTAPGRTAPSPVNSDSGFSLADDLGPMYAVSAFLENLDVRFYAPSPDGTVVPRKTTISVPDGRETREAAFGVREYRFSAQADTEDALWLKRLKSGSAFSSRIGVFALADLMRECEKDHPDWAARDKNGGLILSHDLCCYPKYLHKGFRQACAERIRKMFDDDPKLEKLIVMPPGRGEIADYEEILRMRKPGLFPQFPVRDIFFDFTRHIARELKKTHPDRRIVWMGPSNDLLPRKELLDEKTDELMTAAPRPRAPHTYGNKDGRAGYLKSLSRLNKTFRPGSMIQREWWNEFEFFRSPRLPFWFPKALQEVRRGQRENGVTGLLMDMTTGVSVFPGNLPEPPLTHFMIYLNSKLLWDPDLNLDALLSEYCRLWFGPAESEMRCLVYYSEDILSRKGIRTVNGSERSQLKFDDVPVIFQLLDRAKEKTQPGTVYRRRVEELESRFAWLKDAFRKPEPSQDKPLTAQAFPCERTCSGDLSAYRNWTPLSDSSGPNRTEIALGVTDNRDRLLVAVRCFDDKMTDLPARALLPDDPEIYQRDLFWIALQSPLRGPFFLVVNPDGSFADRSFDPESVIQNGSVSGWSDDKTTVKVRRLADRWEAEIHVSLAAIGGPWPDKPSNPPWTLGLDRVRRPHPWNGDKIETTKGKYALNFPDTDSEGHDIHAMRLLPGAADQYVYGVKKAAGKVPPDAAWDGPEWRNVPELRLGIHWYWYGVTGDFRPDARAKLQYDDKYLYVHYLVRDRYVKGEFRNDQDFVCRDSCMEFFTRPVRQGPYFNFECNCVGTLLLWKTTENADGSKNFRPLGKEELTEIQRFHTLEKPFEEEITQPTVWRLALRIPLDFFVKHAGVQLPLTGQVWSANFFKCADGTSQPCWLMWKRAKGFHAPEDFGKIIFE